VGGALSKNGTFSLARVGRSGTIGGISKLGKIWIVASVLLCALAVGAFFALASGGGQGDQGLRLSSLQAGLDSSGTHVVVTGNVRGTRSVLVGYGKNCRLRHLSHAAQADGGRFRLQVPLKASRARARRCAAAVAKRVRVRARRSGSGSGRVRVFACGAGACIERRLTLKQSLRNAGLTAVPGGTRVTVAPGVTVRVPTAPPVAP
jgi:hypothetical protein